MNTTAAAILILSQSALPAAQKIRSHLPDAVIYSLAGRVQQNANEYHSFPACIQTHYKAGRPIIALCATGIIIRSLAPLLADKMHEPPVIAVAEDGSYVVPLLGATVGANRLAERLAHMLGCKAAITTSGERRFGINLLAPPDGLRLITPQNGKSFIAALLNGATVRIEGEHPWFAKARLPLSDTADHVIRIEPQEAAGIQHGGETELVYQQSPAHKGRISIIGLGPGTPYLRTAAAQQALHDADDILGYDFYIDLAGPFTPGQTLHKSDNRQEISRARHALQLAAQGRHAALVSSGDPGIFAMAAAFFEIWENSDNPDIDIDIMVEPGISAAFAAASRMGAPLGHDFAVISLSDNLKSWDIIKQRLELASKADMVLALYNPVSRARARQLENTIQLLRQLRSPDTVIMLAHDIGRSAEQIKITTLAHLQERDVTSRTVMLVGSSKTRVFRKNGRDWVYTPRFYRQ